MSAVKQAVPFAQSLPEPFWHDVNVSRLAAVAVEQRLRHDESSLASMQSKNCSESQAD